MVVRGRVASAVPVAPSRPGYNFTLARCSAIDYRCNLSAADMVQNNFASDHTATGRGPTEPFTAANSARFQALGLQVHQELYKRQRCARLRWRRGRRRWVSRKVGVPQPGLHWRHAAAAEIRANEFCSGPDPWRGVTIASANTQPVLLRNWVVVRVGPVVPNPRWVLRVVNSSSQCRRPRYLAKGSPQPTSRPPRHRGAQNVFRGGS